MVASSQAYAKYGVTGYGYYEAKRVFADSTEAKASVGNFVWLDQNQDHTQNEGERGIPNVLVYLEEPDGSIIDSTTTDETGSYIFRNIDAGDYIILFSSPSNYTRSMPNEGGDDTLDSDADPTTGESSIFTLEPGEFNSTIDAGFFTEINENNEDSCNTISSISSSSSSICLGDSAVVIATSTQNSNINWYASSTGGSPLFTTRSGESDRVSPSSTTVYYAEAASQNTNCTVSRSPIALVVNARPSTPSIGNILETCNEEGADLSTHISTPASTEGGTYEWRTSASPSSSLVSNPTSVGTGTFYLFEKSTSACYSDPAAVQVVNKSCDNQIDLNLLKIADKRNVEINEEITYTITLNNEGPNEATNVVIEDRLPSGLQFISSTDFINNNGILTSTIPRLGVDQTSTLSYRVAVRSTGTLVNIVEVKSADQVDLDSTPGNAETLNEDDDDDEVITVRASNETADLSLTKTVSDNTPSPDDLVTYTIRVQNEGPNTATNVTVSDILPNGLSYESSTGANSITRDGNIITANFNSIPSGQGVEFNILARVTGTGLISNTAQVMSSDQSDPDSTPGSGDRTEDDTDTININVTIPCTSTAPDISSLNPFICPGGSSEITATNCSGTTIWSNGATGRTITVSPSSSTIYTARCEVNECLSGESNPVAVVINQIGAPTISASSLSACPGEDITLSSSGCSGITVWSTGQTGNTIVVTPSISTTYFSTCSLASCESNTSNTLRIEINSNIVAPSISASTLDICLGESLSLTANNCAGVVTWSTGANGDTINVSPQSTTSYTATCTVASCTSTISNTQTVNVTSQQTLDILATETSVCEGNSTTLKVDNCNGDIRWSTGDTVAEIIVTPTQTTSYSVTCQSGSCVFTEDIQIQTTLVTPPIISTENTNICIGESTTLKSTSCLGIITWSNGMTGDSIRVTPTSNMIYSASCTVETCQSEASNVIAVTVSNIGLDAPSVNTTAVNTCPSTTVNLNDQVLSTPTSTGGVFEFRVSEELSSNIISNTGSVGPGEYYVVERSTSSCFSSPQKLTVSIDNCEPEESSADVLVFITGDTTSINIGEEVKYTITVTNNGPKAARNIQVENILPSGLQLISEIPNLSRSGDTLRTNIERLENNQSISYTYTAELKPRGETTNRVTITSLEQQDPNLANNISEFNLLCNDCDQPCVATALSASTTPNDNGSWVISFSALIQNCGDAALNNIRLLHDLSSMFSDGSTFSITEEPTVSSGSNLIPNKNFNGITDTNILVSDSSRLTSTKIDTVFWVITLSPNELNTTYSTNTIVNAQSENDINSEIEISDISNDGLIINKPASSATEVTLEQAPAIGLALAVSDTTSAANGSIDITYQVVVKNTGVLALDSIVIVDTLSNNFFSPASFSIKSSPNIENNNSTLVPNPNFNGSSDNKLTLATSSLAVGEQETISFTINLVPDSLVVFQNQAFVTAIAIVDGSPSQLVQDSSNEGLDPDRPGMTPTRLNLDNTTVPSEEGLCIGSSLYVADYIENSDGSYDITYHALLSNCGTENLTAIELCDTLSSTFLSPAQAAVVGSVGLSPNSTLRIDESFNGVDNTCLLDPETSVLAPGKVDTVKWTINVQPNGNKGPFKNNVTVKARSETGQQVSDLSNLGLNPDPEGAIPTVLNFNNLTEALIGLAKELESIQKTSNGLYEATFNFTVRNYGNTNFEKVQVQDDLEGIFGELVRIDTARVIETSDNFTANPSFSGKGRFTNLLDESQSSLLQNGSGSIRMQVRLDLSQTDRLIYNNMALAVGFVQDSFVDDQSTDGNNPDPDADGIAENNSAPTIVDFNEISDSTRVVQTPLGVAKSVSDTIRTVDGSIQVTYLVVIKNYSDSILTNLSLMDTLSQVFTDSTNYAVVGDVATTTNSSLRFNTNFDGTTDFELLGDSSILAAGVSDTIIFNVKVRNDKSTTRIYNNSIYGSALLGNIEVSDWSQRGLNPDPDEDGNPGNNNEETAVSITSAMGENSPLNLRIQGGISPNGDDINDKWLISGITEADNVAVKIYNRWGHLVFISENYREDFPGINEGWDAKTNTGIKIGDISGRVPDGTYFYAIESDNPNLWGNKPTFGSITIEGGN